MDSAPAPSPLYWCHLCNRQTTATATSDDPLCSLCNGGFIEELDADVSALQLLRGSTPSSQSSPPLPSRSSSQNSLLDLSSLFQSMVRVLENETNPLNTAAGAVHRLSDASERRPENNSDGNEVRLGETDSEQQGGDRRHVPPAFLLPFPSSMVMMMQGGMPTGLLMEGLDGSTIPHRFGDYFLGSDLERLIQMLSEHDQNNYGTPPAAKSAVESLPLFKITEDHMLPEKPQCAVCKEDFDLHEEAREMPCKHMYHPNCILPWLAQHNSCPLCRHELPTDDPEYEARKREQGQADPLSAVRRAAAEEAGGRERGRDAEEGQRGDSGSGNNGREFGVFEGEGRSRGTTLVLPIQWTYRLIPILSRGNNGDANNVHGSPNAGSNRGEDRS